MDAPTFLASVGFAITTHGAVAAPARALPSKSPVWVQRSDAEANATARPRLDARDEVGVTATGAPLVSFEIGKRADQVDKRATKAKAFRGKNWVFAGVGAGRGLFFDGRDTAIDVDRSRAATKDDVALRFPETAGAEGPLRSIKVCSGENGIEAVTLDVTGERSATYTTGNSGCRAWRKALACPAGSAISGIAIRWNDAPPKRAQEERAKIAKENQLKEGAIDFVAWEPRFAVDVSAIRCSPLR